MKIILYFSFMIFFLTSRVLNANDFKSFEISLQQQRNLSNLERVALIYFKELNEFLNKENVDEYQKNKALQWAHILMDEVRRVRMERISVMWYLRQG